MRMTPPPNRAWKCPYCSQPVPFLRVFGRGKHHRCKTCGALYWVPRLSIIPALGLMTILYFAFVDEIIAADFAEALLIILAVMLLGSIVDYFLLRIGPAQPGRED